MKLELSNAFLSLNHISRMLVRFFPTSTMVLSMKAFTRSESADVGAGTLT